MSQRRAIAEEARKWLDVPFVDHGRVRAGLDCLGLVIVVCNALGVDVEDKPKYRMGTLRGKRLLDECDAALEPVGDPQEGDVGVFWVSKRRQIAQHIALFGTHIFGGLSLIHAETSVKRVAEHMYVSPWPERLIRAYKLPGVV